jgi:hypothetical protein
VKLDATQQARIDALLYDCEDAHSFARGVSELSSSIELHELAFRYNWDDGLEGLRAIVSHPKCDLGTALMIYWHGEPEEFGEMQQRDQVPVYYRHHVELLVWLARRLVSGDFAENRIRFDPSAELNVVQRRKLARNPTIPDVLKSANC